MYRPIRPAEMAGSATQSRYTKAEADRCSLRAGVVHRSVV